MRRNTSGWTYPVTIFSNMVVSITIAIVMVSTRRAADGKWGGSKSTIRAVISRSPFNSHTKHVFLLTTTTSYHSITYLHQTSN